MKAVGNFIIVKDDEVVQKNELGLIITEKSDMNIRYIIPCSIKNNKFTSLI